MPGCFVTVSDASHTGKLCLSKEASVSKYGAAFDHNLRIAEKGTEHIMFPEMGILNHELVDRPDNKDYVEIAKDRVKEMDENYYKNRRSRYKNSVAMFEVVMSYTADPEQFVKNERGQIIGRKTVLDMDPSERARWEAENLKWLRDTFRDPVTGKDNVIAVSVHYDESSPHIHAMVIPEYDGHLVQNEFISKKKLYEMQHNYGLLMNRDFGLRRPIERSITNQKQMKKFHSAIAFAGSGEQYKYLDKNGNEIDPIEELRMKDGETKEQQMERIKDTIETISISHVARIHQLEKENTELISQLPEPDKMMHREITNLKARTEYAEELVRGIMPVVTDLSSTIKEVQEISNTEEDKEMALEKIEIVIQQSHVLREIERLRDIELSIRKKKERIMQELEEKEKEEKETEEKKKKKKKQLLH